jgi:hypothetical protein
VRPPIPPYYRQLLEAADRYRDDGEHAVAVIVAQTACELVTEAAFETFFRARGLTETNKKNLVRVYDLSNERTRALYALLSADKIQGEPFWNGFKEHAKRRHGIVHKGQRATRRDADASLRAATDLVTHIEAVIARASAT